MSKRIYEDKLARIRMSGLETTYYSRASTIRINWGLTLSCLDYRFLSYFITLKKFGIYITRILREPFIKSARIFCYLELYYRENKYFDWSTSARAVSLCWQSSPLPFSKLSSFLPRESRYVCVLASVPRYSSISVCSPCFFARVSIS